MFVHRIKQGHLLEPLSLPKNYKVSVRQSTDGHKDKPTHLSYTLATLIMTMAEH